MWQPFLSGFPAALTQTPYPIKILGGKPAKVPVKLEEALRASFAVDTEPLARFR